MKTDKEQMEEIYRDKKMFENNRDLLLDCLKDISERFYHDAGMKTECRPPLIREPGEDCREGAAVAMAREIIREYMRKEIAHGIQTWFNGKADANTVFKEMAGRIQEAMISRINFPPECGKAFYFSPEKGMYEIDFDGNDPIPEPNLIGVVKACSDAKEWWKAVFQEKTPSDVVREEFPDMYREGLSEEEALKMLRADGRMKGLVQDRMKYLHWYGEQAEESEAMLCRWLDRYGLDIYYTDTGRLLLTKEEAKKEHAAIKYFR